MDLVVTLRQERAAYLLIQRDKPCGDPCTQSLGSPDQTHLSPASGSKRPLNVISYSLLSTSGHGTPHSEHAAHTGDMVTLQGAPHNVTASTLFSHSPSHSETTGKACSPLPSTGGQRE